MQERHVTGLVQMIRVSLRPLAENNTYIEDGKTASSSPGKDVHGLYVRIIFQNSKSCNKDSERRVLGVVSTQQ